MDRQQTPPNQQSSVDQVLRWPEVHNLTKIARNTAHTLARANKFPRPIKLSANGRASGWLLSEILIWLQSRIAERDSQGGNK